MNKNHKNTKLVSGCLEMALWLLGCFSGCQDDLTCYQHVAMWLLGCFHNIAPVFLLASLCVVKRITSRSDEPFSLFVRQTAQELYTCSGVPKELISASCLWWSKFTEVSGSGRTTVTQRERELGENASYYCMCWLHACMTFKASCKTRSSQLWRSADHLEERQMCIS